MSLLIYDLQQLYRYQFGGTPYRIDGENENAPINDKLMSDAGYTLQEQYEGKEIWLPVKFTGLDASIFPNAELALPYSVVKISGKKTIIKTALAERVGSVKELYGIDDYQISIKGFLIDEQKRLWPETQIQQLKQLFEQSVSVGLDNALTNVFLNQEGLTLRVVIESLDFPEVEGGSKHIRPFSMMLESDAVFTLNAT